MAGIIIDILEFNKNEIIDMLKSILKSNEKVIVFFKPYFSINSKKFKELKKLYKKKFGIQLNIIIKEPDIGDPKSISEMANKKYETEIYTGLYRD